MIAQAHVIARAGPSKRGEEAVTGRVHFDAAEAPELRPNDARGDAPGAHASAVAEFDDMVA